MRMARTITLVLLGGGVVLGGASMLALGSTDRARQRECQEARAARRPDAEQICAAATRSTYRHGGSGIWFWGRSAGGSYVRRSALAGAAGFRTPVTASSSRGGFGSTVRGFFSARG